MLSCCELEFLIHLLWIMKYGEFLIEEVKTVKHKCWKLGLYSQYLNSPGHKCFNVTYYWK